MAELKGSILFEGYGFGKIVFDDETGDDGTVKPSLGYDAEKKRYEDALAKVKANTLALKEKKGGQLKASDEEIIEAHLAMLDDGDLADAVEANLQSGDVAEGAIQKAGQTLCDMLTSTGDSYIMERVADVKEIVSMILAVLTGKKELRLDGPSILFADNLGVSTLLSLDKKNLKGIVLYNTGKTAHASIVIRSMGIPCIIEKGRLPLGYEGKDAILDACNGVIYTDYDEQTQSNLEKVAAFYEQEQKDLLNFMDKPCLSKDGKRTQVFANIAKPEEATPELAKLAEGIGLFRSEFIYLDRSNYPDEETQFQAYKRVVSDFGQKRTIIRTFDIGTDKKADYFNLPPEANPALGYRSIRICRDRPELFLTQLKALYRASAYGNLAIMIPMIIDVSELDYAIEMSKKAMADLDKRGLPYNKDMDIGIMIETPAGAVITDELAKKAKFFSIGTNDLTQYTLAIDRTNENVARFSNPHHEALLRLIKLTVDNAHKHGIPVGICGELGHDSFLLPFFLKIGVDELSMTPTYILKTKKMASMIDTSTVDLKKYIGDCDW